MCGRDVVKGVNSPAEAKEEVGAERDEGPEGKLEPRITTLVGRWGGFGSRKRGVMFGHLRSMRRRRENAILRGCRAQSWCTYHRHNFGLDYLGDGDEAEEEGEVCLFAVPCACAECIVSYRFSAGRQLSRHAGAATLPAGWYNEDSVPRPGWRRR